MLRVVTLVIGLLPLALCVRRTAVCHESGERASALAWGLGAAAVMFEVAVAVGALPL